MKNIALGLSTMLLLAGSSVCAQQQIDVSGRTVNGSDIINLQKQDEQRKKEEAKPISPQTLATLQNQREKAHNGGYEKQYDKAVKKNGGWRTQQAVERAKNKKTK